MFNKILNLISKLIVIGAVILVILLGGVRLIGFTPYAVTTGSMEPKYKVGSLVYVRHIDPQKIEVGDVITFRILKDELATHRVIKIEDIGGSLQFWTKGDANNISDGAPVNETDVVGKVYFTIPMLGFFANFLSDMRGKVIFICAALILLVIIWLNDYLIKENSTKAGISEQNISTECQGETSDKKYSRSSTDL